MRLSIFMEGALGSKPQYFALKAEIVFVSVQWSLVSFLFCVEQNLRLQ